MGCFGSKGLPVQTPENTHKILCLGVGGCGKTTFVKQMKIIHQAGWSAEEVANYIRIIRGNYVNGLQECLDVASGLGLKVKPENQSAADKILSLRARHDDVTPEIQAAVKKLYPDPAIQAALTGHSEQMTIKHLPYFYENMARIVADDFVPTDEDILRCRQRTAGASSVSVFIDRNYFEFFDIGGQKPERAKWEQVLKDNKFSAILYFVAADEYDVGDEEKEYDRTKLEISSFIFSEIVNSNIIEQDVPIVIFLNRRDLLAERLKDQASWESFQKRFPDYDGPREPDGVLDFILDVFLSTVKDLHAANPIKHHYTCALDTGSLVVVWRVVREHLLDVALRDIGLGLT